MAPPSLRFTPAVERLWSRIDRAADEWGVINDLACSSYRCRCPGFR